MRKLSFLHFDTSLRTDPNDDPFNCTLTLASPLRNIKKIYLKSCEIPLGFFNVRTMGEFTFTVFPFDSEFDMTFEEYTFKPRDNHIILTSTPNAENVYFAQDENKTPTHTVTSAEPIEGSDTDDINYFPLTYKITVPAGNYTIDSLIEYINKEIEGLNKFLQLFYKINRQLGLRPICLSKVSLNDTGAFPVGFVRLLCNITNASTQIISKNYLTNTLLGFGAYQQNSLMNKHITAPNLWGIYNDLAIYIYFPTIPHDNTHFGMQLLSFKIPMNSGYQAISFNAESQNFSQYIEVSDKHFILNNLKLVIYDTKGNVLVNQYNWNFTLGFET
jgi:hypothetical protein